ncbi:MAG: ATPase, T2SS/T4P/T4SS family, partial [Chloroflexota bacterium]
MSFLQRKLNDQQSGTGSEPQASAPPASASPSAAALGTTDPSLFTGRKRVTPSKIAYLRKLLRPKLLKSLDEADDWLRSDPDKIATISERLRSVVEKLAEEKLEFRLNPADFTELKIAILDDLIGFGAIEPLVRDRNCSEIMVNGPAVIFAEIRGKLVETDLTFDDEDHILWTAQRIVRPLSRTLDRAHPMTDARLPDGSRVHIVTEPSALLGTTITIRKFPEKRLNMDDLL